MRDASNNEECSKRTVYCRRVGKRQDKGGKEERFGQKKGLEHHGERERWWRDNFQTLKMISERNARGQGMKRAVVNGGERSLRRAKVLGGEKLVYKQKLRKYITNCNGESESRRLVYARRKWALQPPPSPPPSPLRESNPQHLLCYIVTRKLRFYKWSRAARPRAAKGESFYPLPWP